MDAISPTVTVASYFEPGGLLEQRLPGYEARPAQWRMAEMVERVLEGEGVALVEAGTGTGKTLAYLVPAILSGRKVVVSTATKTLQDQIVEVDLPRLAETFGLEVSFESMKGLSNYLCLRRYEELARGPESQKPELLRRLPLLDDWAARTERGERSELAALPEGDPLWAAVMSSTDTRIGPRCRHHEACFVTRMRRAAEKASIVVVNHHLYFADLAIRGPHGGGILPAHDVVIFDEAHQIEDVATQFFGVSVSRGSLDRLQADASRALTGVRLLDPEAERVLHTLSATSDAFFAGFATADAGPRRGLDPDLFRGRGESRHHALDAALEALQHLAARLAPEAESLSQIARRAKSLADALATVAEGDREGRITWQEQRGAQSTIGSSPIDVSALFREEVLRRIPSVVLTSATLSTDNKLDFVKRRLGVDFEIDEAMLPSPFDFERQAALYIPSLSDPRADRYAEEAAAEIHRLIELTGGGAFVLCTSLRMMRWLSNRLGPRLGRPAWIQGEAPKSALLDAFRRSGDGVLFATQSFWEGVDVPGEALRLVIIDKLPFDVPSDPLVRARCERLEAEGEAPFIRYLVPAAALALKQGFGRLIRSSRDRGVVAILDSRLERRGYGRVLLRSLPPARRCQTFEDVVEFWRGTSAPPSP